MHTVSLTPEDSNQATDKATIYIYVMGEHTDDDGIPDGEDARVSVLCTDIRDTVADCVGDSFRCSTTPTATAMVTSANRN